MKGALTRLAFCRLVAVTLAASVGRTPAVFDVRDLGAVGDGVTFDTAAMQRAVDACSAAGGGTVRLDDGTFLSGSLTLGDRVILNLGPSAVLLGSARIEDYPSGHLIEAEGARGVGIEGRGVIDGQGPAFWDAEDRPKPRPEPWIDFRSCRDVSIRSVRFRNSPAHTINLTRCRRVVVEDAAIVNPFRGPNTDGIDINGSSEVFVRGTLISTGDDAICLKARDPDMVVENVIVSDCILASDDAALKVGTGSGGTVRHCTFSNTAIRRTRYGVALFMKDGGTFHNIRFTDLSIETGTRADRPRYEIPVFMDIEQRNPENPLGRIRDVTLSGIDITTRGGCLIAGQPERPIENLTLTGITMRVHEPQDMRQQTKPRGTRTLTEPAANDYSRTPAHVVLGHLEGLRVRDLRVIVDDTRAGVGRHALWAKDLRNAVLDGFEGQQIGDATGLPAIDLTDVIDVVIRSSRASAGTVTWLGLAGRKTIGVRLIANDLAAASQIVVQGPEVPEHAIISGGPHGE